VIVEQGGMLPAISKASTPRRISPVLTGEEVIAKGIAAIAVRERTRREYYLCWEKC